MENKTFEVNLHPWENDILWQIADIIRTSPINPHYPHGYDCEACRKCGNECMYDSEGSDCNFAFVEYFEKELQKRGISI